MPGDLFVGGGRPGWCGRVFERGWLDSSLGREVGGTWELGVGGGDGRAGRGEEARRTGRMDRNQGGPGHVESVAGTCAARRGRVGWGAPRAGVPARPVPGCDGARRLASGVGWFGWSVSIERARFF